MRTEALIQVLSATAPSLMAVCIPVFLLPLISNFFVVKDNPHFKRQGVGLNKEVS